MRILYLSQYYPPEMGAPSARVSELARAWAAAGHDVTVLTAFPHHPHGVKRPEDVGVLTRREIDPATSADKPVKLVRTYVFAAKNAGFVKRILSYASFMLSAMLIGPFRTGRADVVIATSPQLFTAVAGRWLAFCKRAPFVFEVRDLWPESIVTVGAMREGFAIRRLKRLAASLYSAANHIVTVGDGYTRGIVSRYGVDSAKITAVTNGVDLDRFRFDPRQRNAVRATNGWREGDTVVTYIGTHGMAHGLETVLAAARRLKDRGDIRFALIGDGAEKDRLTKLAGEWKLPNVSFLPQQGKDAVVGLYAASDICLAPLRKVELFQEVLPSKIFEVMGMERALVLSVAGDAKRIVDEAESGVFVEPEDDAMLANTLRKLADEAERRASMGIKGRLYVEQHFDRRVLAAGYLDLLAAIVATGRKTVYRRPQVTTPSTSTTVIATPADATVEAACRQTAAVG